MRIKVLLITVAGALIILGFIRFGPIDLLEGDKPYADFSWTDFYEAGAPDTNEPVVRIYSTALGEGQRTGLWIEVRHNDNILLIVESPEAKYSERWFIEIQDLRSERKVELPVLYHHLSTSEPWPVWPESDKSFPE